LIRKVNNHFVYIEKELKLISSIQSNNIERLIAEGDKCNGIGNAEAVVRKLNDENEAIQKNISSLHTELEHSIQQNSISENFNYLCLFGALYCILILLLNGFELDFSEPINRELFGLFNILSILILIWIFKDKKSNFFKKIAPSYNKVLIVFPICIFLVYPVFFYLQKWFPAINCQYDFSWFNLGLSVLLPTGHFIYYSLKSSTKTKKQSKGLKQKSSELKLECEDFAKKIQTAFDTVNTMVKEG
jgi:Mg2+ and Co2+ transporter CorA